MENALCIFLEITVLNRFITYNRLGYFITKIPAYAGMTKEKSINLYINKKHMNQEIQNFLSDLYKIDGDLVKYEKELIKIIENLIQSKPDVKFDDAFKERLKTEIMAKIDELKKQNIVKTEKANVPSIFDNLFLNRFSFAIGGAVFVALIMLPFLMDKNNVTDNLAKKFPAINLSQKISKLDKGAFGKLSGEGAVDANISAKGNATSERAYGLGGGSAGISMDMTAKSVIAPGGYFPGMTNYEYVYAGEEFTITENEVEVLRRLKDKTAAKSYSDIVKGINIDLVNLSKFNDTELINISINEDREFGYSYSLSFTEGVSIYSNWEKWPHPEQSCRDEACYTSFRLKEGDVPADEELIALADGFIKEYGIDMSHYGAGKVQDFWRQYTGVPESDIYIPEEVSVLYPLIINGKEVYENGGSKSGLGININIRYKKVSAAYSIIAQNYESSNYDGVTNIDDILNSAKKGGMTPIYRNEISSETVKLEMDTPLTILLKYYSYNQDNGKSEELIIPALLFPVKNIPTDANRNIGYIQQNVIVPLVKEIFDQYQKEQVPQPILFEGKPVDTGEIAPADDTQTDAGTVDTLTVPEEKPTTTDVPAETPTSEATEPAVIENSAPVAR
ncbi:MAG: hypothetical protein US83_C0004G0025 [Candidatus Falkowbacteria bacterium GW2011_GWC2_38_22]|uniref:Uncharacterized protein n=1 Tax=Candidatus Falkowbacteria bacterium GW2011_GWE1_38_31 TaxID=1618638 RepID=A0A0G0JVH5_9BACT|nr:MAG: hypothetical protein US73_C0002G0092 [Candidatus Falkowbacteria bacterium GW2011_GWF2_38_1205]KKQ61641.1 MAG: hypothetical protein US83_C0004G0025 [Candidatus Falkowbacteria bacterium GW2011_GWC2_38_22]KKQ63744.1 MAG: hypothetical protein US84_C0004G0092 [Candidatus Falkowbacteria bacterium GW2011_GWF1_38_22]KKQ65840.1 MAG: hypothetical protein US87_C0004G0025 [Candidatus Falkowbacteria bacterium GW2011_GWE2_38_254]KKQ70607.1 MAG: hypothetical protein US91_C0004G0092 [Candidatus Falkowb